MSKKKSLPARKVSQVPVMGAEDKGSQPPAQEGAAVRVATGGVVPPITPAQFLSWKQRKDAQEAAQKAEAAQKRAADIASGAVQMNGRELFPHEPWVFDNNIY